MLRPPAPVIRSSPFDVGALLNACIIIIGVKGQGQTLKTLKSNISKTVRDREMVFINVK